MNEIFVQTEGNGKNTEVEVIKEINGDIIVCSVETGFVFSIASHDFTKMYSRKKE